MDKIISFLFLYFINISNVLSSRELNRIRNLSNQKIENNPNLKPTLKTQNSIILLKDRKRIKSVIINPIKTQQDPIFNLDVLDVNYFKNLDLETEEKSFILLEDKKNKVKEIENNKIKEKVIQSEKYKQECIQIRKWAELECNKKLKNLNEKLFEIECDNEEEKKSTLKNFYLKICNVNYEILSRLYDAALQERNKAAKILKGDRKDIEKGDKKNVEKGDKKNVEKHLIMIKKILVISKSYVLKILDVIDLCREITVMNFKIEKFLMSTKDYENFSRSYVKWIEDFIGNWPRLLKIKEEEIESKKREILNKKIETKELEGNNVLENPKIRRRVKSIVETKELEGNNVLENPKIRRRVKSIIDIPNNVNNTVKIKTLLKTGRPKWVRTPKLGLINRETNIKAKVEGNLKEQLINKRVHDTNLNLEKIIDTKIQRNNTKNVEESKKANIQRGLLRRQAIRNLRERKN